jgi:DNA modification methylase
MRGLRTHSFDVAMADPPYIKDDPDTIGTKEGYGTGIPDPASWLWEVKRVVKPNGHILVWEHPYNLDAWLRVGERLGLRYKSIFIWHVTNRHQVFENSLPYNHFDLCMWFIKPPAVKWVFRRTESIDSGSMCDIVQHSYIKSNVHVPGAKPLTVVKTILRWFVRPGDWVLDPFCGTGTTARAALELGANSVTIELRRKELEAYLKTRLLLDVRELDLFSDRGVKEFKMSQKHLDPEVDYA